MSVKQKTVFGINESIAKEILEVALSTGGDFAEVYMEETSNESFQLVSGRLEKADVSKVKGAAVRIIKGDLEVNCSTTVCTKEALLEKARVLAGSFEGTKTTEVQEFNEVEVELHVNPKNIRKDNIQDEVKLMQEATKGAKEYSAEIVQVLSTLTKKDQHMFVFASDGTWATDHRCNTRIGVSAVASDGKSMQSVGDTFGRNQGMEMFEGFNPYEFGKTVAANSVEMLHAEEMTGGEMPVVRHNGFGCSIGRTH